MRLGFNMKKKIKIIIFFGFLINVIISSYYIQNYNSYEKIDTDNEFRHNLIKGVIENHWIKGHKLKEDINSGKNFFTSGETYNRHYLPGIIFYIYSKVSGDELLEKEKNKTEITKSNKKFFYLLFQNLFYCFALIFLTNSLQGTYSNRFIIIFVTILAFEPTINQWHNSFYQSSIFTSFQILLISFLLKDNFQKKDLVLIGLLLGLLFAQRSAAVFYYYLIIIYFLFFQNKNRFKVVGIVTLSYLSIIFFILAHNYYRSGLIYITPLDQRTALHVHLEPLILSDTLEKDELADINYKMDKILDDWKKQRNLNLEKESDLLVFYDEMKKRSIISILSNPIKTSKIVLSKTFHSGLLDPVHVYFFHTTEYEGVNSYYGSKLHKSIVKYRLVYSILIYLIVIYGFFNSVKSIKKKYIFLITFSYLYFLLILGWTGSTRYYASCLPFLFFFLSIGIESLIKKIKN